MSAFELTQEQSNIISADLGHHVITAVAGSGKTTTLAHRIKHLLSTSIDGRRLLVLMFNRAAQQDFSRKLNEILPREQRRPEVRTFHAMGYRLYQRFIQEGFLPPFQKNILSDKETQYHIWRMANRIVEPSALTELKRNKKEHIELAMQFFDTVKAQLQSPDIVFEALALESKFRYFLILFDEFECWRKQQSRISYADMLYDTVHAILANPRLEALVSNKMDVVLVDEYQDTNDIQHALLKLIAGQRAKITIVGDPDQTIYEFRGAKPEYMISGFAKEYPDAQQMSLSYSFRYGHRISLLANHLIGHNYKSGHNNPAPANHDHQNKVQQATLCKSHKNNPASSITLHKPSSETHAVVNLLKADAEDIRNQSAILVRTWSQTVSFELALLEHGISYRMDSHKGVFASEEFQAIQSLLALASGQFSSYPDSERQAKFEQILRFPHVGLPESDLTRLSQQLGSYQQNWGKSLLESIPEGLKKIQTIKLQRLAKALARLERAPRSVKSLLLEYVREIELYEGMRSLSLNHDYAEEKIAATESIIRFVSQLSGSAVDVLQHLSELRTTQLRQASEQQHVSKQHNSGILISSIHRAKGLEWHTVYIPGFSDRNFPYSLRSKVLDQSLLESERRLLYVAMTRAKHALHLIAPSAPSSEASPPSRFEHELNWEQSAVLGEALDLNQEGCVLRTRRAPSRISRHYAELFNCRLSFESPTLSGAEKSDVPIWTLANIEHAVFGIGFVVGESHSSFTVKFEDKEQRVFSKETAARFFAEV